MQIFPNKVKNESEVNIFNEIQKFGKQNDQYQYEINDEFDEFDNQKNRLKKQPVKEGNQQMESPFQKSKINFYQKKNSRNNFYQPNQREEPELENVLQNQRSQSKKKVSKIPVKECEIEEINQQLPQLKMNTIKQVVPSALKQSDTQYGKFVKGNQVFYLYKYNYNMPYEQENKNAIL